MKIEVEAVQLEEIIIVENRYGLVPHNYNSSALISVGENRGNIFMCCDNYGEENQLIRHWFSGDIAVLEKVIDIKIDHILENYRNLLPDVAKKRTDQIIERKKKVYATSWIHTISTEIDNAKIKDVKYWFDSEEEFLSKDNIRFIEYYNVGKLLSYAVLNEMNGLFEAYFMYKNVKFTINKNRDGIFVAHPIHEIKIYNFSKPYKSIANIVKSTIKKIDLFEKQKNSERIKEENRAALISKTVDSYTKKFGGCVHRVNETFCGTGPRSFLKKEDKFFVPIKNGAGSNEYKRFISISEYKEKYTFGCISDLSEQDVRDIIDIINR